MNWCWRVAGTERVGVVAPFLRRVSGIGTTRVIACYLSQVTATWSAGVVAPFPISRGPNLCLNVILKLTEVSLHSISP